MKFEINGKLLTYGEFVELASSPEFIEYFRKEIDREILSDLFRYSILKSLFEAHKK